MGRRVDLHHILEDALGSKNVYFEPPESFKLTYPCIVYYFSGHFERPADNDQYNLRKQYSLTYITPKADDDTVVNKLERLRYCGLSRAYVASNLHHYAFNLYY